MSLLSVIPDILDCHDPNDAYRTALAPIMEQLGAHWSALLSFGHQDRSRIHCIFSTEKTLNGKACHADAATICLFGDDCDFSKLQDKAITRLHGCITAERDAGQLAYLPFTHAGERLLLLLKHNGLGKTPTRLDDVWLPLISALAGCARTVAKLRESEQQETALKQRIAQLLTHQNELQLRANHDDLTGLSNREFTKTLIENRLHQEKGRGKLALAFVDLDDFKRVNDTYGHETGDKLLRKIAERLRSGIRSSDICGRIGGDEFVICVDDSDKSKDFRMIFSRIANLLRQPYDIEKTRIVCSASIGVSISPEDGHTFDELLQKADTAMYMSKHLGKGRALLMVPQA